MGETTVIEWSDATWNPWRGCDKVSPGCAECYMFRDQRRYGKDPSVVVRAAESTFYAPLRAKKWQAPRKVFTCSWSDWFHEDADGWRDDAWDVIRQTPQHTYQVLTKRPERIADHLPADWGDGWPNVWLGVTIENERFVHRADILHEVPAAVRFISAEPLLGPLHALDPTGIDWLITGGESGGRPGRMLVERREGAWVPKAQALDWVRDLRAACHFSGTAFLHKQWGGPTPKSGGRELDGRTWDEMPDAPALEPKQAMPKEAR